MKIKTLGAPKALAATAVQVQDSNLANRLQVASLVAAAVATVALCAACGGGGADENVLVKTQQQEEPPCKGVPVERRPEECGT